MPPWRRRCGSRWSAWRRSQPRFVSVTYGADGSTRERTHKVVTRIQRRDRRSPARRISPASVRSRGEILDIARGYWDQGIRHLVALRGDPPQGAAHYVPHPQGFAYAADLVAGSEARRATSTSRSRPIRRCIREAASAQADLDNLKRKIDAGRDPRDHAVLLRHRSIPALPRSLRRGRDPRADRARHPADHALPAGAALRRALRRGDSRLAAAQRFEGLDDDAETRRLIAASVAIEQVQALARHGVREFHFYTLNRAELTLRHLPRARRAAAPGVLPALRCRMSCMSACGHQRARRAACRSANASANARRARDGGALWRSRQSMRARGASASSD